MSKSVVRQLPTVVTGRDCIKYFLLGLVTMIGLAEVFSQPWQGNDSWTLRKVRENTALEMHAEDIWINGHSTLVTFEPQNCTVTPINPWWGKWLEVACTSLDVSGRTWIYTALYGVSGHHLTLPFPFLVEKRVVRNYEPLEGAKGKGSK